MFLSRIRLDLSSRNSLAVASDAYEAHRFIFSAFSDSKAARPLYRVESGLEGVTIIAQSLVAPDWDRAKAMHGVMAECAWKPYPAPPLETGSAYRFRLVANAVKTINDTAGRLNDRGRPKSVRVPIVGEDRLLAWLSEQGARSGFTLKGAIVKKGEDIAIRNGRGKNHIRLGVVGFDGELSVEDGPSLWAAVSRGLGHGKGFGLGLLSIAPIAAASRP